MKQEKKEILLNARTRYQTIVDIIDDILENENEAAACKKYNFPQMSFRHYVQRKPFTNEILRTEQNKIWLEPYQRLYCDVFGIESLNAKQIAALPVDFNETVRKLIKELTGKVRRVKEVVCMYYFEEMNYHEIAEYFSLSSTRIRDIHHKALRMMRHPKIRVRLIYGDKMLAEVKKLQKLNQKSISEIIEEIQEKLDEQQQKEIELIEARDTENEKYKNMDIFELTELMNHLSTRSNNCIIFNYFHYYRDSGISAYEFLFSLNSIEKILSLEGAGVKSANDIVRALKETFGIEVTI